MALPAHPLHALAVYAEDLVARRRVLVLGSPETGLEARLEEMGAVAVVLVAPQDDLSVLRGARFDVALVTDLGLYADPAEILARVRAAVGDAGVALVAAANREAVGPEAEGAFDYYDLFDLVAAQFADVRMIARLPFHGVALVEMSDDDAPAVSVDTQLVEAGHAPEAFVALASQRGATLDPYAIIALPEPEPEPEPESERAAPDTSEADELRAALVAERFRVEILAVQARELEARAAQAVELDRELGVRMRQVAALAAQLEQTEAAVEAGRLAVARVAELTARTERAEASVARLEPEAARLAEAHADELGRFEASLRERAAIIRQLEAELARRERMVLDLVQTLDEHAGGLSAPNDAAAIAEAPEQTPMVASSPAPQRAAVELAEDNARLCERLDAMALELARREADAQAAAWTLSELQRRVDTAPGPAPSAAPAASRDADPRLETALDELDALRKALVQEHDLRVRAEAAASAGRASPAVEASSTGAG